MAQVSLKSEAAFIHQLYRKMISKYNKLWKPDEDKHLLECIQSYVEEECPDFELKEKYMVGFKVFYNTKVSF